MLAAPAALAKDYAIVVGSYASQTNAQRARLNVEEHLRQRGIGAQVQLLPANNRIRVAVSANTQNSQRLMQQLRQSKYPDAWRLEIDKPAVTTATANTPAPKNPLPSHSAQSKLLKRSPPSR